MNSRLVMSFAVCLLLCRPNFGAAQTSFAPRLSMSSAGNQILVTWPTNLNGFTLETSSLLGAGAIWTAQTNGVEINGTNLALTIVPSSSSAFYRLHSASLSQAIIAPPLTWTWVPFSDCYCMEGSTTGLGVSLSTNSSQVLIYFIGGGACWNYTTCYLLNTATHGPFGEVEFTNLAPQLPQTWFLDRSSPANPFQNYSYVLVPYCTGDVHAGSKVDVYGTNVTMQVGFQNVSAYLKRLVPTFPAVTQIVLAGSSGGGFGAAVNWRQTQQAFPSVRVDLIDDSGPIMTPDVLAEGSALFLPASEPMVNWNFQAALPPDCDTCLTNVSSLYGYIEAAAPAHRIALLSYTEDETMRTFLGLSVQQFADGLTELSAAQLSTSSNAAYFFVPGQSHVLLFNPTLTVNGITLQQFITQMVTDDPAWKSP